MRVVHIGFFYGDKNTGGAAIAATRIHRMLLAAGVDSIFVCCRNKSDDDRSVIVFPPVGSLRRKFVILQAKVTRNMWRLLPERRARSLRLVHTGIVDFLKTFNPDIVHIHWLADENGSLEELIRIPCPLVIHLHDMWMLNGFDPYPHTDRRYVEGFTRENSRWLERSLWKRKVILGQRTNVAFVGPSKWVKERAEESIVARSRRVFYVPYPQDETICFCPSLRTAHDKCRILFGAYAGRANPIKGYADLESAVMDLPTKIQERCELLVFGENAEDCRIGRMQVRFLGIANSSEELIGFYHYADIFAFPSREETWGQTKSEALLCGLPVVAFDRTACAEGIQHRQNGWVAKDGDIKSYSDGIMYFFNLWEIGLLEQSHNEIAQSAKRIFTNEPILNALLEVYRDGR